MKRYGTGAPFRPFHILVYRPYRYDFIFITQGRRFSNCAGALVTHAVHHRSRSI
jgi:hypothetical protein